MSERTTYPAGVPCWVTNLQRDVPAARRFYEGVLGWETVSPPDASDAEARWALARLRGRDVCAIGTMPESAGDARAMWMTEVRVDALEPVVDRVRAAGGTVVEAAVEMGPIGRLAVVADPSGALVCAFEPGTRAGAQLVNEPGAWSMSLLRTSDPEGAAAFYGAVFGWETMPFGPATMFRLPGYVGGEPQQPVPRDVVAAMVEDRGGPARWHVDFWVDDAEAAAERALASGGSVIADPYDAPPFRQAVLADPEGAPFSVSQLVAVPVA